MDALIVAFNCCMISKYVASIFHPTKYNSFNLHFSGSYVMNFYTNYDIHLMRKKKLVFLMVSWRVDLRALATVQFFSTAT